MKLSHKILYSVMPFIIIPVMMIGALAFYKLKQTSEERLNTQAITLLEQISQFVSNKVSVSEGNLLLLADHQLVTQYMLADNESLKYEVILPNLLGVFKSLQESIPDYYEIKLILLDGLEDVYWAADGVTNIHNSISQDDYFKELQESNDTVYKRLIFDENTRKYSLLIVRNLLIKDPFRDSYNSPPTLRGYLAITLNLEYLQKEINKNIIGESGYLFVTDNNGKVLFKPDRYKSDFTQSIPDKIPNSQYSIIFNGVSSFIHSAELPAGMRLISVLPEREVINSSLELGKLIIIITLIATIAAIILVFFALRYLVLQPISDLNAAAKVIGSGNLDLKINISRDDEIGSLACSFMDMSKNLKKIHGEVSYTANHDGLTGLPNRIMFHDYLSKVLLEAKQNDLKIALLFLDLDDFKEINDTLGHQAGDVLLQEVATRLSSSLRKKDDVKNKNYNKASDIVARLGGDEFIILLNEVDGPFDATAVADRIFKKLKDAVNVSGNQVYANCSIGITFYPDDGNDASELIKHADIAMYYAKGQGKNHYQFYSQELNTVLHNRLHMTSRMRVAIEQNSFFLHYQLKVDANTLRITGFEALLRWRDAELGMISPADFIPLAEENGLITPITEWVLKTVCRQCTTWMKSGLEIVPVAVNISSIQFKRRDLLTMVTACLQESGLEPGYIEIELTETSLLTDTGDAIRILTGLYDLGIKVALDDFGTGYSSLSYLNQLPINTLKIDRSFVNDIVETDRDYPVIDAIIALAHALDLQVVAEGVETSLQVEYLKQRNCDVFQGYFLGKPMPADEIPELLTRKYLKISP